MEITYDSHADALYIRLRKGKFARNKTLDPVTIFDLDKKGNLLGIELLNASKRTSVKRSLRVKHLAGPVKSIEIKGMPERLLA